LEFAMHAVNAKGKILSGPVEELSMNLDAALLQQVKQKGILIKREFAVPSEARQLRVVVVDSNSLEAGSLVLPIGLPDELQLTWRAKIDRIKNQFEASVCLSPELRTESE